MEHEEAVVSTAAVERALTAVGEGRDFRMSAMIPALGRGCFPASKPVVRGFRVAALFPLPNGLNIASELLQVREVVTGQHSHHHAQGLRAALIVLAGALQIRR